MYQIHGSYMLFVSRENSAIKGAIAQFIYLFTYFALKV